MNARWLIAPLGISAAVWAFNGDNARITFDEAWFLHVLRRITSGEVLYRDVYYGVGPLAVYVALPAVALCGAQLLAIRILHAACFVASALLAWRILHRVAPGAGAAAALVLGLCSYGRPSALGALYNPLAYLFLLGTLAAALKWKDRACPRALWLAGGCAGLSFVSKHTIGAYALGALLLALAAEAVARPSRREKVPRWLAAVLLPFIGTALLALVPVFWSGAAPEFVESTLCNKAEYVRLARVPYSQGLGELLRLVRSVGSAPLTHSSLIYWQAAYLLPPAALILLLAALWRHGPERGITTILLLFSLPACAGLFPIGTDHYIALAAPVLLVAVLHSWRILAKRPAPVACRLVGTAAIAFLALGWLYLAISPGVRLAAGETRWSALPHFRGLTIDARQEEEIRRNAVALRQAAQGEPVFVVSPAASLYYLASGVSNPTRYDYPLANVFGPQGQRQLAGRISAGQIGRVCLDSLYFERPFFSALRPLELERFVRARMKPLAPAGFCQPYAGSGAAAGPRRVATPPALSPAQDRDP